MKAYVILEGAYSDRHIVGVTLDPEMMSDVLGEIYFHNATSFYVGLYASVDEIPHLEVRYECCPLPLPRNCEVKVKE